MDAASQRIESALKQCGFRFKTASFSHVSQLRDDIDSLVRQGLLDTHIVERYMQFDFEASRLPAARTVLVVSMPQPITRSRFSFGGNSYAADVPPTYIGRADDTRARDALASALGPAGFKIARALLPVKTLAARTGLARYGRNNITYVPGAGSFQRLIAFYSDFPAASDNWGERRVMKACENCTRCADTCPPKCIPANRFLLHANRCLTWFNESGDPMPGWVKTEWHNALIGCMRCQLVCPVNKRQLNNIAAGPEFSEAETESILSGTPLEKLPQATRAKLDSMGAESYKDELPRNLRLLIEAQRK